ncbi:hypothetical protein B566_EDAN010859 [Ephemera danica]|nr:hypothetical protein B566_EDAN010859 [Ephemera danica]
MHFFLCRLYIDSHVMYYQSFFHDIGVDGTRAFVTGEFNETGLIDDVSGLNPKQLKSLYDWLEFYKKDYKYVGKVIGNFYDSAGEATKELRKVLKAVRQVEKDEQAINKEKQALPPCNVEWNQEQGFRVWCTTKSGGVKRNWAGVPRRLVDAGVSPRCVCVEPKTAVSDPRLGEYEDCPPGADSCWVREI